ncbi:MAG: tyrosine-protein kinase family protein [Rhizobacter sp.]
MSSLIEQAAQRLEQLRQAGISVPGMPASAPVQSEPEQPRAAAVPVEAPVAAQAVPSQTSVPTVATGPTERATKLPLFGDGAVTSKRVDLNLTALHQAGFVTPMAERSRMADQYRVIKRPLISNAMGKGAATINHANLIMVTSALPGEGKTFTAINLAMSIAAELDNSVMLVDADVARPSLLRTFGLPVGPGLLDLLQGRAQMSDVLLRTNVDKLTLLPSGHPQARATEMLASDAMRQLLDDMAQRYSDRIIIFDSPPLLLTTEARALAAHMGQIVVVVHAGKTLQREVHHALSTIEACPVKLMLLNQATEDATGDYGYGYGYGYGYSKEKNQEPAATS